MAGKVRLPIEYWPCAVGSMLKCLQLQERERERREGRIDSHCRYSLSAIHVHSEYTAVLGYDSGKRQYILSVWLFSKAGQHVAGYTNFKPMVVSHAPTEDINRYHSKRLFVANNDVVGMH